MQGVPEYYKVVCEPQPEDGPSAAWFRSMDDAIEMGRKLMENPTVQKATVTRCTIIWESSA